MDFDKNKYIKIYELSSDIVKELFLLIYKNYEMFINTKDRHPLEDYIIKFDEFMDDNDVLLTMGERIGFGINYDESDAYTPPEQFYDRVYYTIINNTSENIKKIMNMTIEDYIIFMKNKGIIANNDMYYDRLNIDSHQYNELIIDAYNNLLPAKEKTFEDINSNVDEGIIDKGEIIETDISVIKDNEDDDIPSYYDNIKNI